LEQKPAKRSLRWTVVVTLSLLLAFGAVFLLEFMVASERAASPPETLTADTYTAEVNRLLAPADALRGEALFMEKYECHICHVEGAGKVGPDIAGIARRAATAHSPLLAAAYLYESIVYPQAHIAGMYQGTMPTNYGSRLSDQDLGDIIAYLFTR
jgi:cytochrome c2